MDIKPGDFIKVFTYRGQVQDVFKSSSGRVVAEVLWAKDIARSNPVEFVELDCGVEPSNRDEFWNEISDIRVGQDERINEVLRGSPML